MILFLAQSSSRFKCCSSSLLRLDCLRPVVGEPCRPGIGVHHSWDGGTLLTSRTLFTICISSTITVDLERTGFCCQLAAGHFPRFFPSPLCKRPQLCRLPFGSIPVAPHSSFVLTALKLLSFDSSYVLSQRNSRSSSVELLGVQGGSAHLRLPACLLHHCRTQLTTPSTSRVHHMVLDVI